MESEVYQKTLKSMLISIGSMLKKKHHDYGAYNLTKFGMFGIIVRMSDKLARIENLVDNKDRKVQDETIDDTLMDLAGYAIQALVMRKLGLIK